MKPTVQLLVCDLDNTLYDWVGYFSKSISALISEAANIIGISPEEISAQLQEVHKRHSNIEHPFSLLETAIVRERYPNLTPPAVYELLKPAFSAFNTTRKKHLSLYPGTKELLQHAKSHGTTVVAHTEAAAINAEYRLDRLGLATSIDCLYASNNSNVEHPLTPREISRVKHIYKLSSQHKKPSPATLLSICERYSVSPSKTIYIGDSLTRDIAMAIGAGCLSAWAKYGANYLPNDWNELLKITHWTNAEIERHRTARDIYSFAANPISPTFVLEKSPAELIELVSFNTPSA